MSSGFKNILYIDAAMNGCGVGVSAAGTIFADVKRMERGQGEELMPMVEAVVRKSGLGFGDFEAVITTVGPGTFTGLRVGISAAKSMATALDIPLFGITTLQALALEKPEEDLLVIIETKREDFYVQAFGVEDEPRLAKAVDIERYLVGKDVLLIGDGVERFLKEAKGNYRVDFSVVLPGPEAVLRAFGQRPEIFMKGAEPVYLRGADVSQSKKEQRILASNRD